MFICLFLGLSVSLAWPLAHVHATCTEKLSAHVCTVHSLKCSIDSVLSQKNIIGCAVLHGNLIMPPNPLPSNLISYLRCHFVRQILNSKKTNFQHISLEVFFYLQYCRSRTCIQTIERTSERTRKRNDAPLKCVNLVFFSFICSALVCFVSKRRAVSRIGQINRFQCNRCCTWWAADARTFPRLFGLFNLC